MADQSQVEQAIVNLLAAACYPNGTGQPSAIGSAVNLTRGWPTEAGVSAAVKADVTLIAVHAASGFARDVTRYPLVWQQSSLGTPTITATVSGAAVTIGGTVTAGNVVGVMFGPQAAPAAYAYAALGTDTAATIATALAAKIPGASSAGAVLTLPSSLNVVANVVAPGNALLEVGRMQQGFMVSAWAPSPALRDAVMGLIWPAAKYTYRMALPDGTVATLMQGPGSGPDDVPSRALMFRRDLRLFYDYPVTMADVVPQLLFPGIALMGNGALTQIGAMEPSTAVQTNAGGEVLVDAAGNLIGAQATQ